MTHSLTPIGDADFKDQVLDSAEPVLVDFWANWCPPCKAMTPLIEEMAARYQGKIRFRMLDIDEHQVVSEQFGVRAIPTLLLFKGGKVIRQIVGAVGRAKLEEALRQLA